MVALRLRFARGRSAGGRGGVQFYRQPVPLTPAPIAARRKQGVSSETIAPSSANLRQQGVDKSLLVLGGALVDACIITYRTRAARHKLLIPSISSANSTPAFAGRWDRKRPISPAQGAFLLTGRGRFLFQEKRKWGRIPRRKAADFLGKSADIPRRCAAVPCPNGAEKNTSTGEAGGCQQTGIALCSSRTR